MNTAIYSPSGASAGIGFAIPVDTLRTIVETIIRDGKVGGLTEPHTRMRGV
jgi:S1-C subfamily serine protease